MKTILKRGMGAIALAATILLAACSTTGGLAGGLGPDASVREAAAQPLPDPKATITTALRTINYTVLIDDGFDSKGVLHRRTVLTMEENFALAQINNFCATGIIDYVDEVGLTVLKRGGRAGSAQILGSVLSTVLAFKAPTADTFQQVVGLTTGTGMFASLEAADQQVGMILMSAHANCVTEMIKRHDDIVGSLVGIQLPGMKGKPIKVLAPGEDPPTYD